MTQVQTCGICDGKGYYRCPICHGKGSTRKETHSLSQSVFNADQETGVCHSCEGTGKILCKICGGAGKIMIEKPGSTGFKNFI